MAIKLTPDSFLTVVKQSGLVEHDQLKLLVQEFKSQDVSLDDSRSIADAFVARGTLTRWQADKLLQGKHKGFFLGKYRLLSLLGKGGMSSVYLAEHVLMRRRCAIKVLPSRRVKDTSYLARFHREAQAVASLDHLNIVRAYDVDKETDKDVEIHFLVMEYVEGRDLQDLVLKQGPLGFVEASDFIRQAADGLAHAHQAGMVHRDIKPGNLLVDGTGVVKILDLGLARFFDDKDENSLTVAHDEKILGTADYLAPEQALDSHKVDARADVYSLGCTFYFVLTGHPPFTEGTLAQRLMAHQTKDPPRLEDERPDIPPDLLAIVNRMMAKKVDQRYQTAAEAAEAIAGWLLNNAGEDWRLKNPALIGGGSGSGIGSTVTSTTDQPLAPTEVPLQVAPVVPTTDSAQSPQFPAFQTDGTIPIVETQPSPAAPVAPSVPPVGQPVVAPAVPIPPVPASTPQVPPAVSGTASESEDAQLANFLSDLGSTSASSPVEPPPAPVPGAEAAQIDTELPTAPPVDQPFVAPPLPSQPQTPVADKSQDPPPVAAPLEASLIEAASFEAASMDAMPIAAEAVPAQEAQATSAAASVQQAIPVATAAPVGTPVVPETSMAAAAPTSSYTRKRKSRRSRGFDLGSLTSAVAERKKVLVAVLAGLLTVVIAYGVYVIFMRDSATNGGGIEGSHGRLTAEVTVGPKGQFKTIGEALDAVRKQFNPSESDYDVQTIRVSGGAYDERIVIENQGVDAADSFPDSVRLVCDGTERVVLAPPGEEPVVVLRSVESFTLEGFEIKADDKPVAVEASGYLLNASLRRVEINGYSQVGVSGIDIAGWPNQAFTLDEVTFRASSADAVGVKLQGGSTRHVNILGCRFYGPMSVGVVVAADAANLTIRESVFTEAENGTGVQFAGSHLSLQAVHVENNTFYKLSRGLSFSETPGSLSSDLRFSRNLFAELTGPEAFVGKGFTQKAFAGMANKGKGISHNWSSRPAPQKPTAGEVDLFANGGRRGEKGIKFASTDPGSANYLAPKGPAANVDGASGDLKPYIGAVAP